MSSGALISRRTAFGTARAVVLFLWVPLTLLHGLYWFTLESILGSVLAVCGGVVAAFVLIRRDRLRAYPISTVMMIGYAAYYFYLPPLATLIERKSIVNNLDHPIAVFVHALVCQVLLLIAYLFYTRTEWLQRARRFVSDGVFLPAGYFRVPSDAQLFAMGGIGLGAMAFQVFVAGAGQGDVQGAANKLMQALFPLAYIPFCILIRPVLGAAQQPRSRRMVPFLAIYTIVLFVVSLGHNTRSAFLIGVASIAMAALYGAAVNVMSIRLLRPRNVLVGLLAVLFAMGPLADMATSMVIVRQLRRSVPPSELVQLTLEVYQDKDAIRERRLLDATQGGYWDERYVDNIFFARLSNLKFADNGIGLAERLDDRGVDYLRRVEWHRVVSILPRPVIEVVAPSVDKNYAGGASGGDFLLYAVTGSKYALGGFRVGSLFGSGYGLFGWFYPFVLAVLAMPIFVIGDAQTRQRRLSGDGAEQWQPVLAPMAAIGFFAWFFYFTSGATGAEALSSLPSFFIRDWLQSLLIYAFAFWLIWAARGALQVKR